MKQYLNFDTSKPNLSIQHSFSLVFRKIETLLFAILCVIFLVSSKVKADFSKNISFSFISVSTPVVKVISFPFNVTISLFANFNELVNAKSENKTLKEDLAKLKHYYVQSLNIHQENKELRNALNFITSKSSNYKVAQVIGSSNQLFNQKVLIDAGKNRELKEGSVVIGSSGVIGRVLDVGEDKSQLLLLNDAISRIPVIASKARTRGILVGNNSNLMEILYLPKNHHIEVGDLIFTSGDGDSLLAGLLVGVVKEVGEVSVLVSMVEDVRNANIVTIIE